MQPVYQTRGLRQGCNLSSILFAIYISDLGHTVIESKLGCAVPNGKVIGLLMFADDLVFIAGTRDEMDKLAILLQDWCSTHVMKISSKKTQILSPDHEYQLVFRENGDSVMEITQANSYKYLGIEQKLTVTGTINQRQKTMISKAKKYKGMILRQKCMLPDTIEVYLALWNNVALPSILYGVEALPVHMSTIRELDKVQNELGKAILGVSNSTLNAAVNLELGVKSILHRVITLKLLFINKCMSEQTKCKYSRELMEFTLTNNTHYMQNMNELLSLIHSSVDDIRNLTPKQVDSYFESVLRSELLDRVR